MVSVTVSHRTTILRHTRIVLSLIFKWSSRLLLNTTPMLGEVVRAVSNTRPSHLFTLASSDALA